jgi:Protein of unknown function (DUF3800)
VYILYFDESGDLGPFVENSPSNMQPIFALGGVVVPQANVTELTSRLMALKRKHYGLSYPKNEKYELLRNEIKGKDIRRELRKKGGHARAQLLFIDDLLATLKSLDCHLLASIYVKGLESPFDGKAVYTTAVQKQVDLFQKYLTIQDSMGLVIADSRYNHLNSDVSHAVLTQQNSRYAVNSRLVESPVFGNSENHAGLQVADIIVSALIVPIALATYRQDDAQRSFNYDFDHAIKLRYATKLKKLQLAVKLQIGTRFGFYVNDSVNDWEAIRMFVHTSN